MFDLYFHMFESRSKKATSALALRDITEGWFSQLYNNLISVNFPAGDKRFWEEIIGYVNEEEHLKQITQLLRFNWTQYRVKDTQLTSYEV